MSRASFLHPSALSPLEYDAYTDHLAKLEAVLAEGGSFDFADMMDHIRKLCFFERSREPQILAFFRNSHQRLGPGEFLAILRLIAHSRTNLSLTRDHIFIQASPLDLTEASTVPTPRASSSNPFRKDGKNRNRPTVDSQFGGGSDVTSGRAPFREPPPVPPPPTTISSSSNPFRARAFSANALPPPSLNLSVMNNKAGLAAAGISPPLPPRPRKSQAIPDPIEEAPSMPPPPKRSVPADLRVPNPHMPPARKIQSTTYTPTDGAHTTASSPAANKGVPPLLAPKPKLLSSTHIGPSTRLRSGPSPAPMTSSEGEGGSSGRPRSESSASQSSYRAGGAGTATTLGTLTDPFLPEIKANPRRAGDARSEPSSVVGAGDDFPLASGSNTTLQRSRTLGSKPLPPPPPRRKPEALGDRGRSAPVAEHFSVPHPTPFTATTIRTTPLRRASSSSHSRSTSLNHGGLPGFFPGGNNAASNSNGSGGGNGAGGGPNLGNSRPLEQLFGKEFSNLVTGTSSDGTKSDWLSKAKAHLGRPDGARSEREGLMGGGGGSGGEEDGETGGNGSPGAVEGRGLSRRRKRRSVIDKLGENPLEEQEEEEEDDEEEEGVDGDVDDSGLGVGRRTHEREMARISSSKEGGWTQLN